MGRSIHCVAFLLVLPGILTDEHINHNYDGKNFWTIKMFYDNYKENVKLNQTFRLLDYFNKENHMVQDYVDASMEGSDDFPTNLPESATEEIIPRENFTPVSIHEEEDNLELSSPNSNEHLEFLAESNDHFNNASELSRKTDLEERGLRLTERKHPPYFKYPHGKVEIHVFRGASVKYTDIHGHSNYFAPWGYFITQPSNPEYKHKYYPYVLNKVH